jgi:lipopolysaccharide/colanic/teichoic acid biosynthesis glycosyltransferase
MARAAEIGPTLTPRWKRIEDLVLGIPVVIVSLPLLIGAALAIVLEDGPPVLYWDERVGLGGRTFRVAKLRTMVQGASGVGLGRAVAARDPRVTRVGRLLRRWSLDELPQLWSVLRGDMSLVGPRPTIAEQVRRYAPSELSRLRVRPGMTGLAQVSGRNDLPWSKRIELDLAYVAKMSPWMDALILLRTPLVVFGGTGLYGRGGVTPDYGDRTN